MLAIGLMHWQGSESAYASAYASAYVSAIRVGVRYF
jgi:hypothetical protein